MSVNLLWIRIFDLLGGGTTYLVIAIVFTSFLRQKDIGHRTLILGAALFCYTRAISTYVGAWDLWVGGNVLAAWFRTISAIYGGVFACVLLAAKDDVLITLRITEEQDRRRKDLARDVAQMLLNREYLTQGYLDRSRGLVRDQRAILMDKGLR